MQQMTNDWIARQWENADFGDPRLNERAVLMANLMMKQPGASLPDQMGSSAAIKGAYRFLSNRLVSHEVLQKDHYQLVLEQAQQSSLPILFIQDGSELLFNGHPATSGLGPTADAGGHGCMIHSALAVVYGEYGPTILGLARQYVWTRGDKTAAPRIPGSKESGVWAETLKAIGSPPPGVQWVAVCDRGADVHSFFDCAVELKWDLVVRLSQDRNIAVDGRGVKLKAFARSLPALGDRELVLRSRASTPAKTVRLHYAVGSVVLPVPEGSAGRPVTVQVVRVWGGDLEWILMTTLAVAGLEDAQRIASYYENRWIIEEYHKALKTGFSIESSQLETAQRLFNLLGLVGVLATQLLLLRDLGRFYPKLQAAAVVPPVLMTAVDLLRPGLLSRSPTAKEFIRAVASIGGFIGRKGDGDPGWITIWKGWRKVLNVVEALTNMP